MKMPRTSTTFEKENTTGRLLPGGEAAAGPAVTREHYKLVGCWSSKSTSCCSCRENPRVRELPVVEEENICYCEDFFHPGKMEDAGAACERPQCETRGQGP
mmetsp:Transcript_6161/g.15271  ORF Transcript_6161/g.15271 Transcript_6161/m.15271 type:complete len:101 (+) Transcript_6161:2925-3227(+)